MLFVRGHKRIIILKARQIGFSTLLGVVCCDQLCFNPGQQISLIDQTLEDARQKLKNIVVLAYDSMAAELRAGLPIIRSNTGEVCVKYTRFEEAKASVMYAGTHSRGGSNSLVWVSEWGTIQATDIARSEEILTGALPSVGDGICVIESTWRGGRHGHLWGLVKQALETPEEQKGPFDWRLAFFPWYEDPGYCDALPRPLSVETRRYFEGKPGLSVNPGQTSWYQRKRDELGMFILREYPSTLEECFQSPVEGAIYAEFIDRLRAEGAIRTVESRPLGPGPYVLGLGKPGQYLRLVFQIVAGEIRVIDIDMDLDLTPVERVSRMLAKGYLYSSHFLPLDAMATQKSGRTFLMELKETGLANVKAVPRTYDVWIGINRLRGILPPFRFRVPECERGLEALCAYHTVRETSTGIARDEPCHDASSHACDALRSR